jgi:hypothetical protein
MVIQDLLSLINLIEVVQCLHGEFSFEGDLGLCLFKFKIVLPWNWITNAKALVLVVIE